MGIALLLVGHVTKEGAIAGPKLLEHMVDVVLYFEGEKGHPFRVLKGVKNRFGSVSEIGIFEMTGKGLMEVTDPSGLFINGSKSPVPGMVVFPSLSGSRTMMVEVQALVSKTYLPVPRRVVVGLDQSRSQIVTTIVEKHCGIKLYNSDLYLNVAGGMRIFDTGGDLPLAMAIMSGALDKPIQAGLTGFGEVGLGGEVRPVPLPRQRVAEAVRMGFRSILVPSRVAEELNHNEKGVEIIPVTTVRDLKRRVI
jgi:DNA repair protein RadA/Sms